METGISKKVTWKYLLKFSLPTILSQVLIGFHGTADGIFVSRLVDPIALSAVGIVWPVYFFAMSIGIMMATGGNALFAKKLGQGLEREAKENFTFIFLTTLVLSVIISAAGLMFPGPLLNFLGADGYIYYMALEYFVPILIFAPTVSLGIVLMQSFVTEGKPHIATIGSIAGATVSVGLNVLLIYVFQMGLTGAAIATGLGNTVPCIIGVGYFAFKRKGSLYFVKPKFDIAVLIKSTTNGASEMVGVLATSITSVLMNNILMRIQGPEAVAALGIIWAGMNIITAVIWGYGYGVSPIASYNYGKGDWDNLKRFYSNSLRLLLVISVIGTAAGWLLTEPLISIYGVMPGTPIYEMTFAGFRIFVLGFAFMAYNIFATIFFTALNNGKVSAIMAFFRTFVFFIISVLALSELFGLTGAWIALPFADVLAIAMSVYYIRKMKKVYGYA